MTSSTPVPYHVFLSYSSEDLKWANAVCAVIEQRQLRCWMAPRDIAPGTEWGAAIVDGIDRCRIMVLVFSSHANNSSQVRREVERAVSKGLAILPVRIEDVRPQGAMEYALSNTHWLDAFTPPATQQLTHLADSVEALLGRMPPRRGTTTDAPSEIHPAMSAAGHSGSKRIMTRGIVGGFAVLLAVLVVMASVYATRVNSSQTAPEPAAIMIEDDDFFAVPDTLEIATPKFQGRWVAIYRQVPERGPLPASHVTQQNTRWIINGNELEIQFSPAPGKNLTIQGRIFMFEGNEPKPFSFRSFDEQGNRQVWLGIYDFDGEILSVCYRVVEAGHSIEARPDKFPGPDDRGVWFTKFRRAKRPMAARQS